MLRWFNREYAVIVFLLRAGAVGVNRRGFFDYRFMFRQIVLQYFAAQWILRRDRQLRNLRSDVDSDLLRDEVHLGAATSSFFKSDCLAITSENAHVTAIVGYKVEGRRPCLAWSENQAHNYAR
ncbi:MAG: hypothetical protein QM775_18545 [Pirellulales bacterium]